MRLPGASRPCTMRSRSRVYTCSGRDPCGASAAEPNGKALVDLPILAMCALECRGIAARREELNRIDRAPAQEHLEVHVRSRGESARAHRREGVAGGHLIAHSH